MITSAVRRFLKLGGLAGRVGASVVTNQALDLVRSGPSKKIRQTENLVKNAIRIVETLGELKGAAMKVGQMLSLHEGLLPPEVAEVLGSLQKEAPKVPAEVMEFEVRGGLENFDELFESFDFEAFAAASIGQVHRARLRDGRDVAVKVQYPLIDEIVKADLKNLKTLMKRLFALFTDADFEPSVGRAPKRASRRDRLSSRGRKHPSDDDAPRRGARDRDSAGRRRGHGAQRPDHGVC